MIDKEPASVDMASLARVMRAAIGILLAYWKQRGDPPDHPYRQAAMMLYRYFERYQ